MAGMSKENCLGANVVGFSRMPGLVKAQIPRDMLHSPMTGGRRIYISGDGGDDDDDDAECLC